MTALAAAALACTLAALVPAALRWLRVAQREHYLAGSVTRFALRWWRSRPLNLCAALAGLAGAGASIAAPGTALVTAAVGAAAPLGLGVRGRTSKLAWTRRLRTLAAGTGVLVTAAVAIGAAAGGLGGATTAAAFSLAGLPLLVDAALGALSPLEDRLAARFVAEAGRRIAAVRPRVVAITGSYGKTSTKGYVAHLLAGRYAVVASPRSFNNRAGLARTVNQHLVPGTDVLVAEMGTFGPGEIAELCSWLVPDVAVITAVGPVHLERFGSVDAILAAKSEITERAEVCVLNVDDDRLLGLADRLERQGKRVVRCSGQADGGSLGTLTADGAATPAAGGWREPDVRIVLREPELILELRGRTAGSVVRPDGAPPVVAGNVACAVGAAMAIGLESEEVLRRLADLPGAANRLAVERSASGAVVLDDTYNSNPAGGRVALEVLQRSGSGRRVVVTPGMVELGRLQLQENETFGAVALGIADVLVVVGRTNRRALLRGAGRSAASRNGSAPSAGPAGTVICVERREQAVEWVRRELGPGDTVLYENDLPDHYP